MIEMQDKTHLSEVRFIFPFPPAHPRLHPTCSTQPLPQADARRAAQPCDLLAPVWCGDQAGMRPLLMQCKGLN